VIRILPAKVSRRCPYQVVIFSNTIYITWFSETYNCGYTTSVPNIVTWYGHLRDTFAGKISTTFSQLGRDPKFLSLILPAKVSRNLTDFQQCKNYSLTLKTEKIGFIHPFECGGRITRCRTSVKHKNEFKVRMNSYVR
jgi:hypothetical protein